MQITPRYEGPPLLRLEGYDWDAALAVSRQRRRLGALLETLDDEQWAAPSRCAGWSVRDVVAHLNSTNRFWVHSIAQGQAGSPTRFLEGFDPVATPAQLVHASSAMTTSEVLAEYLSSVEALAAVLDDLHDEAWERLAEAPPGHVSTLAVCLHALWDAWVHERDIALPLGLTQPVEHDEIQGSLLYAALLGPAFLATQGSKRKGWLIALGEYGDRHPHPRTGEQVRWTTCASVTLGRTVRAHAFTGGFAPGDNTLVLQGEAIDLIEALSYRLPHDPPVPAEHAWMLMGLAEVFDQAEAAG